VAGLTSRPYAGRVRSREVWIAAGNAILGVASREVLVPSGIPGGDAGPVVVFGAPLLVGATVWAAGRARGEPLAPWLRAGFLGVRALPAGLARGVGPRRRARTGRDPQPPAPAPPPDKIR